MIARSFFFSLSTYKAKKNKNAVGLRPEGPNLVVSAYQIV